MIEEELQLLKTATKFLQDYEDGILTNYKYPDSIRRGLAGAEKYADRGSDNNLVLELFRKNVARCERKERYAQNMTDALDEMVERGDARLDTPVVEAISDLYSGIRDYVDNEVHMQQKFPDSAKPFSSIIADPGSADLLLGIYMGFLAEGYEEGHAVTEIISELRDISPAFL